MESRYAKEMKRYKNVLVRAQQKGLDVEVGVKENYSLQKVIGDAWLINVPEYEVAYSVLKYVGHLIYILGIDGKVRIEERRSDSKNYDGFMCEYSLQEVEQIVEKYKEEEFCNMVKFYGFLRQYEGEPDSVLEPQMYWLERYARENKIQYETIFGCKGGLPEYQGEKQSMKKYHNEPGINNVQNSCGEIFDVIRKAAQSATVVLCVSDQSRLDGYIEIWRKEMKICFANSIPQKNIKQYEEYDSDSKKKEDFPF